MRVDYRGRGGAGARTRHVITWLAEIMRHFCDAVINEKVRDGAAERVRFHTFSDKTLRRR